jgi:hypothetical protein
VRVGSRPCSGREPAGPATYIGEGQIGAPLPPGCHGNPPHTEPNGTRRNGDRSWSIVVVVEAEASLNPSSGN